MSGIKRTQIPLINTNVVVVFLLFVLFAWFVRFVFVTTHLRTWHKFQFSIFKFQIILGFPDEMAAYRIMVVRKKAGACSRGKIWSNGIKDGSLDQNKRGFLILSRKIRLIRVIRVQKNPWFPCFPCDFFCAICESRSDIQSPIGTSHKSQPCKGRKP